VGDRHLSGLSFVMTDPLIFVRSAVLMVVIMTVLLIRKSELSESSLIGITTESATGTYPEQDQRVHMNVKRQVKNSFILSDYRISRNITA
jgi:hypothetical protein